MELFAGNDDADGKNKHSATQRIDFTCATDYRYFSYSERVAISAMRTNSVIRRTPVFCRIC